MQGREFAEQFLLTGWHVAEFNSMERRTLAGWGGTGYLPAQSRFPRIEFTQVPRSESSVI